VRSAKTLARLLDAAEEILGERGMDGLTVAEVAKRAGSSVGAFYARFRDKAGLMRAVAERFRRQAIETIRAVLEPSRWQGVAAPEIVFTLVAFMVRMYLEKASLLRAIGSQRVQDGALDDIGTVLGSEVVERLAALLAELGVPVRHPEPAVAIATAVWATMGALFSMTMSTRVDESLPVARDRLAAELSRMCIAYVGIE
jgi:AcrR family transcriptional regulator